MAVLMLENLLSSVASLLVVMAFFVKVNGQCGSAQLWNRNADFVPDMVGWFPSMYNEDCTLQISPINTDKSVLLSAALYYFPCSQSEVQVKLNGGSGGYSLCADTLARYEAIVGAPGESINISTTTTTGAYYEETYVEISFLAAKDMADMGCDGPKELSPEIYPQYVSSPNFPNIHTGNTSCSWRIQTNDTQYDLKIAILFVDILSESGNCSHDYLEIQNLQTSVLHPRICDRVTFSKTVLDVNNQGVDVTFIDKAPVEHGFLLEYHLVNKSCRSPQADLVFLLDSSGSIRTRNFDIMLSFVASVIFMHDLNDENIQVGVVTFSTNATVQFHLNRFTSTYEAMEKTLAIKQERERTNTDKGLALVREEVLTTKNGEKAQLPDVLVILTDGVSSNETLTREEAERIKQDGVQVIAVGIQGYDENEIRNLASNEKYALTVNNFQDLGNLHAALNKLICAAAEESPQNVSVITSTDAPVTERTTSEVVTSEVMLDSSTQQITTSTAESTHSIVQSTTTHSAPETSTTTSGIPPTSTTLDTTTTLANVTISTTKRDTSSTDSSRISYTEPSVTTISNKPTSERLRLTNATDTSKGGLSRVLIWGITVTGIAVFFAISSLCGCCCLIAAFRKKKRKQRKEKEKRKLRRKQRRDKYKILHENSEEPYFIDFWNGGYPLRYSPYDYSPYSFTSRFYGDNFYFNENMYV